jgi:NAD(P)-dependent dehydrogenase (short-subunit alcohol dehydrogenase family)
MATPRQAVLITGASSGFGEATARLLAERGFLVYAGVRRAQDGERVAASIGERCIPVIIDVTDAASITAAAQHLHASGGIDALVNNAGIALAGPLEYLPVDELRRQFEVNVFGVIAVTQAMLPMLRVSVGRIVNVGSMGGRLAFPLLGAYAASKSTLDMLTTVQRMELRPFGINVSYIEPGSHKTAIWNSSEAAADAMQARLPTQALDEYAGPLRAIRAISHAQAKRGDDPIHVAEAIAAALTALRPKTRYTVGTDTRVRGILLALPARLRERLITSVMAKAAK